MLRKGDQGSDQQSSEPGKTIELNNETTEKTALLPEDEKAQRFFDEIQQLKKELKSLKETEVIDTSFIEPQQSAPTPENTAKPGAEAPAKTEVEAPAKAEADRSDRYFVHRAAAKHAGTG